MYVCLVRLYINSILSQPVTSQFSGAVFSAATATSLLLPKYHPIVHFVDTGHNSDQPSILNLAFQGPTTAMKTCRLCTQ